MDSADILSVHDNRKKRRKTSVKSKDVPVLPGVISERNHLASILERHGYSTQGLDNFLNGPRSEWIQRSHRFNEMVSAFGEEVSYDLFDVDHQVRCACSVLRINSFKVVFGHEAQGKSQLHYFVCKLLQHCGAVVVYLDPSMVEGGTVKVDAVIEWWKIVGTRLNMPMKFQRFIDSPTLEHFLAGLWLLFELDSRTIPVWVIVDGVTEFTPKHPLFVFLPYSEQDWRPVKWILTGSSKMGDWVYNAHLDMFMFDIPLFTPNEVKSLVNRLEQGGVQTSRIVDAIGITDERLVDWLMEKYVGIPWYIVEFAIAIKNNFPTATFADKLKRNIDGTLSSLPLHQVEYLERNLPWGNWAMLQNLGLCGSVSPNARILQYIFDWIILRSEQRHKGN